MANINSINGNPIVPADGSVTTESIANNSVTDDKLAQSGGVLSNVHELIRRYTSSRSSSGPTEIECDVSIGDIIRLVNNSDGNLTIRLRDVSGGEPLQVDGMGPNETYTMTSTVDASYIGFFFGAAGSVNVEIGRFINAEAQTETNTTTLSDVSENLFAPVDLSTLAQDGYYTQGGTTRTNNSATSCVEFPVHAGERYHITGRIYAYMGEYTIADASGSVIAHSVSEHYGDVTVHVPYDETIEIPSYGARLYVSSEKAVSFTVTQLPVYNNLPSDDNTSDMFGFLFPSAICIGDSTTEGYNNQPSENVHTSISNILQCSYPFYLGKLMNADVENAGASARGARSWWAAKHAQYDYSDYYIAIINLGTNYGLTDTIDEDTASGDYTTYADTNTGKYCAIIEEILDQNPSCFVFLAYPQCRTGLVEPDETAEETSITITRAVIDKIAIKYNLDILDDVSHWKVRPYQSSDNVHFTAIGNLYRAKTYLSQICEHVNNNKGKYNPKR